MRSTLVLLGLLGAALALPFQAGQNQQASGGGAANGYETPYYDLVHKHGDFELRSYRAAKWVCTGQHSTKTSEVDVLKMYYRLHNYISGENHKGAKMPMTMPINVLHYDLGHGDIFKEMCWLVPAPFQDDPPTPTGGDSIYIKPVAEMLVYVKSVSAYTGESGWYEDFSSFLSELQTAPDLSYAPDSSFFFANYYSQPWSIFKQPGEIWIAARGKFPTTTTTERSQLQSGDEWSSSYWDWALYDDSAAPFGDWQSFGRPDDDSNADDDANAPKEYDIEIEVGGADAYEAMVFLPDGTEVDVEYSVDQEPLDVSADAIDAENELEIVPVAYDDSNKDISEAMDRINGIMREAADDSVDDWEALGQPDAVEVLEVDDIGQDVGEYDVIQEGYLPAGMDVDMGYDPDLIAAAEKGLDTSEIDLVDYADDNDEVAEMKRRINNIVKEFQDEVEEIRARRDW